VLANEKAASALHTYTAPTRGQLPGYSQVVFRFCPVQVRPVTQQRLTDGGGLKGARFRIAGLGAHLGGVGEAGPLHVKPAFSTTRWALDGNRWQL